MQIVTLAYECSMEELMDLKDILIGSKLKSEMIKMMWEIALRQCTDITLE